MTITVDQVQVTLEKLLAEHARLQTITIVDGGRTVARLVVGDPLPAEAERKPVYLTREALDRIEALVPKATCPVNDNDLREARAGAMYGLTD